MLLVKITGHSSKQDWYLPLVGTHQAFEVFDFDDEHYKTSYAIDPYKDHLLIKKTDCEIIR